LVICNRTIYREGRSLCQRQDNCKGPQSCQTVKLGLEPHGTRNHCAGEDQ
jgi:hypothetical protein